MSGKNGKADLLKRAQQTKKDRRTYGPNDVANARPGWVYYTIPSDTSEAMCGWYRQILDERGYEMVATEDPEYKPADGRAELWRCPPEVAQHWAADRADWTRSEGDWDGQDGRPYGARMWKANQKQRQLRHKLE